MQRRIISSISLFVIAGLCLLAASCNAAPARFHGPFGEAEWKQSAIPVRPGEPGKAPFWNAYAKRFIYAPAFDFHPVENAVKYRFEIASATGSSTFSFEGDAPYAPLSPVWASVPVGNFDLKVIGVSAGGEGVGVAGESRYFRAAPFDGPYHEPVMPYDKSGMLALEKIMRKPYVEYWLTHKAPDPDYYFYRYPAKIFGSLIAGAVAHAKVNAGTDEGERSTELARIVADHLISISFPERALLEHFPPAYNRKMVGKKQSYKYLIIAAAESGHAYLDLYDHTGDKKYLEAAQRIARTYLKTQLENGSWHLYVNNETGEPLVDKIAIPTSTMIYFERLKNESSIQRARLDHGESSQDLRMARAVRGCASGGRGRLPGAIPPPGTTQ